jgi:hypothetical protein
MAISQRQMILKRSSIRFNKLIAFVETGSMQIAPGFYISLFGSK